MKRNGTEPSRVPARVAWEDLRQALQPLMDLLGTDVNRIYDDPGLHIQNGRVTVTLAGHVITSAAARNVTVGDEPETAEEATEVRVKVRP